MDKNICLKYGYLMFPVNLKIIPEIKINNQKFYCKNNHHVSLINLCDYPYSKQEEIFEFAQSFVKKNPIKLKNITNTFRLVTEGNLQSIIVLVKIKGLKRLISAINQQFGYNIVYPPTHITLFTLKDQFGIGIDTLHRYKLLTQEINPRNSRKLLKSFSELL